MLMVSISKSTSEIKAAHNVCFPKGKGIGDFSGLSRFPVFA